MTKLFGGEILYTSQHAAIYTRQCVTVPEFSVSNFSGTCTDIFQEQNFTVSPQKKLEYFWKGGKLPSLSLCPFAMTVVFSSVPSSRGVGLGSTSLRLPCPSLINGRASDQSFFRGEGRHSRRGGGASPFSSSLMQLWEAIDKTNTRLAILNEED